MIFLINHSKDSTFIERFSDTDKANKRRLELELQSPDRLIFTLDAESEEAVRKTHGRYFQ